MSFKGQVSRVQEVKAQLVAAHRAGDWERAAVLSQEKERLKKRRYCPHAGCGVRINRHASTCRLHANFHPQWKRKLK